MRKTYLVHHTSISYILQRKDNSLDLSDRKDMLEEYKKKSVQFVELRNKIYSIWHWIAVDIVVSFCDVTKFCALLNWAANSSWVFTVSDCLVDFFLLNFLVFTHFTEWLLVKRRKDVRFDTWICWMRWVGRGAWQNWIISTWTCAHTSRRDG